MRPLFWPLVCPLMWPLVLGQFFFSSCFLDVLKVFHLSSSHHLCIAANDHTDKAKFLTEKVTDLVKVMVFLNTLESRFKFRLQSNQMKIMTIWYEGHFCVTTGLPTGAENREFSQIYNDYFHITLPTYSTPYFFLTNITYTTSPTYNTLHNITHL